MHKLLAWWQLLRIGNVFTAASNVIAGFLIVQGGWQPVGPLLVLIAASALLYTAGMVLNDAFDAELDAVERPERPIPSGRISRGTAAAVGWTLLLLGTSCAWFASFLLESPRPGVIGSVLALCIVGYDVGLKSTPLGPWIMGLCRLCNVLLGVSTAIDRVEAVPIAYAFLVGVYTTGLTYFARSENEDRKTYNHRIGSVLIFTALCCFLTIPEIKILGSLGTLVCWGFLLLYVLADVRQARLVQDPPFFFRKRVSRMIQGFILIDAYVVFIVVGWVPASIVLSLLVQTWIASRFAPMT